MKIHDPINDYFAKKGIEVSYNTLNSTEQLVRAYVKEFEAKVAETRKQKSQHRKTEFYNNFYDIPSRSKFTGFEKYKKIDHEFRKKIVPLVKTHSYFSPTLMVDPLNNDVDTNYKTLLKNKVKEFDSPLLYLSGGIDSELVAMSMLDAGVKFIPVIFNYTNNNGQLFNIFDTRWAYSFCAKYGLFPITKNINIEELWTKNDFLTLAIDLNIASPQLVTHAYMVKMMADEFPDVSHVFGGEVRFYTNHILDDGRQANLVLLVKNNPPGYNTNLYTSTSYSQLNANAYLYYSWSTGLGTAQSWQVQQYGDYSVIGSPTSGNWATSSSISQSSYEWRISSAFLDGQFPIDGSLTEWSPTTTTGWASFNAGSNEICHVSATANGTNNATVMADWTIEVRNTTGSPQITVSSTITLEAYSWNTGPP